jgi:chromate transporter
MIFLKLFLTFFEIGAVSFGGGYAMIPLVREKVLTNGWLAEADFLNFLAVAESTPGPIAINMATYIGSTQGELLGSVCATLGVVLPSFIIILIISAMAKNFLQKAGVRAVLRGILPCVVGLIVSTALLLIPESVLYIKIGEPIKGFDFSGILLFAILLGIAFVWKKIKKKKISPILMIVISAGLGMILWGTGLFPMT